MTSDTRVIFKISENFDVMFFAVILSVFKQNFSSASLKTTLPEFSKVNSEVSYYCSLGDGVSRLLVRHRCHLLQQVVRSNDSAVAGCDQTRHHVLRHRRLHLRQLQLQRLLRVTHPLLDSTLDGRQCSGFTSCYCCCC